MLQKNLAFRPSLLAIFPFASPNLCSPELFTRPTRYTVGGLRAVQKQYVDL
jgi:hypothetical protein